MAQYAVELDQVAKRFSRRWVLRGVSLRVAHGEALGILGRNGSGKTTMLRVIATLLRPTRGTGRIFGHELVKENDEIREYVGILGHHSGLYDDLTASENVLFAMRMYGLAVSKEQVQSALDEVGLGAEFKERVRGFSAGMRRRLALARLILRPPKLLLLDEPYAAFDQSGIDQVNAFVRKIVDAGGTSLIVTHDPVRAQAVTDRMVRIDEGKISEVTA